MTSKSGGDLKTKFEQLAPYKGKKVAIIAVTRKMLETLYYMMKINELYRGITKEMLTKKLGVYGLL